MATTPTAQPPATQEATSPAKSAGKKPVATFRYGSVSAAVFTNEVKLRDGKTANVANVSLQRSYRTTQGVWEYTHSLRVQDLLPAAQALTRCFEHIAAGQTQDDERE